jgi:four helix bundle protein
MNKDDLKTRTMNFGLGVIRLVGRLPRITASYEIGRQLVRSGTSVGANYRSACLGKSKADFIAKLCISLEEADESLYWLELLEKSNLINPDDQEMAANLKKEADELTAILTASIRTARSNSAKG